MNQAGTFTYKCVLVMYHSVNDKIKMTMPGRTVTGEDFDDTYRIVTNYIDKTEEYYKKHGTN